MVCGQEFFYLEIQRERFDDDDCQFVESSNSGEKFLEGWSIARGSSTWTCEREGFRRKDGLSSSGWSLIRVVMHQKPHCMSVTWGTDIMLKQRVNEAEGRKYRC